MEQLAPRPCCLRPSLPLPLRPPSPRTMPRARVAADAIEMGERPERTAREDAALCSLRQAGVSHGLCGREGGDGAWRNCVACCAKVCVCVCVRWRGREKEREEKREEREKKLRENRSHSAFFRSVSAFASRLFAVGASRCPCAWLKHKSKTG